MKRYVLSVVLMSMLVPTAVFCQEFGEEEDIERQMELRRMELDLQHSEAEMGLERQMQELELEKHKIHLERERRGPGDPGHGMHHPKEDHLGPLLLLCLVVHILVAVWVYTDIRRLNRGSGIWIVIALLTGLLGVLVYAVVRLGDDRQKGS
ncbi:MAG: hypothetical protein ACYSYV_04470 [Planctomycetota bacterium]|jgi:hypothetical protein